jgi:Flp pilus assembly protein TadB
VLSDHERKTLRELERQLMAEDPEFPRSFDAGAHRLGRKHCGVTAGIAITVAVLLFALMLAVGSLGGALAFGAGTGLVWLAWRHSDNRRQPR